MSRHVTLALALAASLCACNASDLDPASQTFACDASHPCSDGYTCAGGTCLKAGAATTGTSGSGASGTTSAGSSTGTVGTTTSTTTSTGSTSSTAGSTSSGSTGTSGTTTSSGSGTTSSTTSTSGTTGSCVPQGQSCTQGVSLCCSPYACRGNPKTCS